MSKPQLETHPMLKKLTRKCDAGDTLFSQGDMGNTIVLVLQGTLQLIGKRDGVECVIGNIEAGEFIGEKALAHNQPFPRFCMAKALVPTTFLELGLPEVAQLEKESLPMLHNLTKRAFRVAIQRLEKINSLVTLLRDTDDRKRFMNYLSYLAKHTGKKEHHGIRFEVNPTTVFYTLGLAEDVCREWTEILVDLKILIPQKEEHVYIVQDENAFATIQLGELPQAA